MVNVLCFWVWVYLHRDDVGAWGVGDRHPVWKVHAAVAVGPEEGMRVGNHQGAGTLSPLGGILWRLHKRNFGETKVENF